VRKSFLSKSMFPAKEFEIRRGFRRCFLSPSRSTFSRINVLSAVAVSQLFRYSDTRENAHTKRAFCQEPRTESSSARSSFLRLVQLFWSYSSKPSKVATSGKQISSFLLHEERGINPPPTFFTLRISYLRGIPAKGLAQVSRMLSTKILENRR